MPDRRLTYKERENISAVSVLKRGSVYVDQARWTKAHTRVLYHAASFDEVERVLVHPGVKKQLCDSVQGDRKWLNKIRPTWGHHYHFHIRIGCPKGSSNCKPQNSTGNNTGCKDGSLDWWFNVEFNPNKKKKKATKPARKRRAMALSDLPKACSAVLSAKAASLDAATHTPRNTTFVAPNIKLPAFSAANVLAAKPIEASKKAALPDPGIAIPVPTPRPAR